MSEFVPASRLYDVDSRMPIAHPAHQATNADVRRALEQREIRIDGGHSSSDTVQSKFTFLGSSANSGSGCNSVSPQDAHPFRFPIGQISPSGISKAAYIDLQSSQAATSRLRRHRFARLRGSDCPQARRSHPRAAPGDRRDALDSSCYFRRRNIRFSCTKRRNETVGRWHNFSCRTIIDLTTRLVNGLER